MNGPLQNVTMASFLERLVVAAVILTPIVVHADEPPGGALGRDAIAAARARTAGCGTLVLVPVMLRAIPLALVLLALASGDGWTRAKQPRVTRLPRAARVVAIGDLHGDLEVTRRALRLAGAIDENDRWTGGALVVVQTGDQTDRGDDEPDILALLERLQKEAAAAGGRVVVLNGNHELMNVAGDLRYVTPDGLKDYDGLDGRRRAFAPGSPLARALAARPIYAIVGDTLFVHAGVLPAHLEVGLDTLDAETRAWLRGETPAKPRALVDAAGPLWTRVYGGAGDAATCATAAKVLARLRVRRLVVAHTPQEAGVNAICDGRVWRIDVGLARAYGGPLQVLEITGEGARVLRGDG